MPDRLFRWAIAVAMVQVVLLATAIYVAAQAPAKQLLQYQVEQLQVKVAEISHQHDALFVLLVANLFAVLASLATYLIIGRKT
jgi:uncharacterized membrane protein